MDDLLKLDIFRTAYNYNYTVISVLEESGFRLTKFMSNNQNALNQLSETEILTKKAVAEQSDQQSTHTALGILWNEKTDELRIK